MNSKSMLFLLACLGCSEISAESQGVVIAVDSNEPRVEHTLKVDNTAKDIFRIANFDQDPKLVTVSLNTERGDCQTSQGATFDVSLLLFGDSSFSELEQAASTDPDTKACPVIVFKLSPQEAKYLAVTSDSEGQDEEVYHVRFIMVDNI